MVGFGDPTPAYAGAGSTRGCGMTFEPCYNHRINKEKTLKRFKKTIGWGLAGLALLTLGGCGDSGDGTPTGGNNAPVLRAVWRGNEGINQFLTQRCTPCHTARSENDFNVTTHTSIMANGRIIAGNAEGSLIIKKLIGDPSAGDRMPQDGPPYLATANIDTIKAWIHAGARDN